MNCREFRQKHDSYVDDTLRGVDIDGMRRHLRFCEEYARQDTRIRRSLLVARNMPLIQPSADFGARLQARIREENAAGRTIQLDSPHRHRTLSPGAFLVIATGVLLVAGFTGVAMMPSQLEPARLAPVLASAPSAEPSVSAPTMVAAMPAGMPLWPAVMVAQQAPWHFAADEAGR